VLVRTGQRGLCCLIAEILSPPFGGSLDGICTSCFLYFLRSPRGTAPVLVLLSTSSDYRGYGSASHKKLDGVGFHGRTFGV
jgi:hypothetical protein